jgi:hypothetical protein
MGVRCLVNQSGRVDFERKFVRVLLRVARLLILDFEVPHLRRGEGAVFLPWYHWPHEI